MGCHHQVGRRTDQRCDSRRPVDLFPQHRRASTAGVHSGLSIAPRGLLGKQGYPPVLESRRKYHLSVAGGSAWHALTLSGLAILQQARSLVNFIETFVAELPAMLQDLSTRVYMLGPFQIDFTQLDLDHPGPASPECRTAAIGRAGTLVSRVAASHSNHAGLRGAIHTTRILLLTIQIRTTTPRNIDLDIDIPGYGADIQHLFAELSRIWDSFLRGQLIISILILSRTTCC